MIETIVRRGLCLEDHLRIIDPMDAAPLPRMPKRYQTKEKLWDSGQLTSIKNSNPYIE